MSTLEEEVLSSQKWYSINLLPPVNLHCLSGRLCFGEEQITSFHRLPGIDFQLTLIPEIKNATVIHQPVQGVTGVT